MQSLLNTAARRPLLALATGLALGIAPLWRLSPALATLALGLGLVLLTGALGAWLRFHAGLSLALMLASGFSLGLWRAAPLAALLLMQGQEYRAAVRVEGLMAEDYGEKEESGRRALRLKDASVESLAPMGKPEPWNGELRLSFEPTAGADGPGVGDRIRAYGSLRSPGPPMNPGEFDYRAYVLGRHITGLVSLRKGLSIETLRPAGRFNFWHLAWQARQRLVEGLQDRLSRRGADLARGMVLGDTGGLSARDMSVYSRTGLVHILSVSGLHLALALAIFLWMGKKAGVSRRSLAWLALVGAFFYAAICGLPVPCQRALFLFGLALMGRALDLDTDVVTSLAFGMSVILLMQPGALFEAGCQLSFLVSLSLVAVTPKMVERMPKAWPEWLSIGVAGTVAAELATIPLVAWHFSVYSWPSLFASIVTAPLMGPIVGLGLGTAVLGAWLPLASPLEWTLGILDWMTSKFAALPYAAFSVGRPAALWMFLWLACGIWLVWGRKAAAAGAVMASLMLWLLWPGLPWAHRHPGLSKTWFFAVGQGDASLTEFEDGTRLLVDAGPQHPDAGSWVMGPAFRRLGINSVDWAVLTHPHADHYGGLFWVLEQYKVGQLIHSGEDSGSKSWAALRRVAGQRQVPLLDLSQAPPPRDWQGKIERLSPSKPRLESTRHDMHNNNVVLNVGGWMTLMGDMQLEGERRLLKRGLIKPSALLKAGHHGSKTSSSPALLKALKPEIVVIQCGPHNRYRHPSPSTLDHLAALTLFRTDLNGCVAVEHDNQGTRAKPFYEVAPELLRLAPRKQAKSPWKTLLKQGLRETDAEAE